MVKYETIIKIIEEELDKSHQHLRLYESLLPSFNKFHKQTCGEKPRKTEKGLICDNNGNEIFSKTGSKHQISIPSNTIDNLYEKYGELNLTHNHPSIGKPITESLSASDVQFLLQERQEYHEGVKGDYYFPIKSISCESPNGMRMTLVRGDKFQYENMNKAVALGAKLQKAHEEYIEKAAEVRSPIYKDLKPEDLNGENVYDYATKQTLKQIGRFEDTKEFKQIQEEFRNFDCKLAVSYPEDYYYAN